MRSKISKYPRALGLLKRESEGIGKVAPSLGLGTATGDKLACKIRSEGEEPMSITDEYTLVLRRNTLLRQIAALAGWILAAAALVAFANDLVSFAQTGTFRVIPAGEVWFNGQSRAST
jgi:hypothetical protein